MVLFLNTVLFRIKAYYILPFFLYYLFISQIPKLKNFIYKRNKKEKSFLFLFMFIYPHELLVGNSGNLGNHPIIPRKKALLASPASSASSYISIKWDIFRRHL